VGCTPRVGLRELGLRSGLAEEHLACSVPSPPVSEATFVGGFRTGLLTCPVAELSQRLPSPVCDRFTALCFRSVPCAVGAAVLIAEAFAQLCYLIAVVCAANIPKTRRLLAMAIAWP